MDLTSNLFYFATVSHISEGQHTDLTSVKWKMLGKLNYLIFHHSKVCGCVIKKVVTQGHQCNLYTKSLTLSVIAFSVFRFYHLKFEKLRKKQYPLSHVALMCTAVRWKLFSLPSLGGTGGFSSFPEVIHRNHCRLVNLRTIESQNHRTSLSLLGGLRWLLPANTQHLLFCRVVSLPHSIGPV